MQKADADEKVGDVKKKISESQGQIALIAREIVAHAPSSRHETIIPLCLKMFYHMETGVISGELKDKDAYLCLTSCLDEATIPVSARLQVPPFNYLRSPDFAVPVKRKLVTGCEFCFTVSFSPEELREAKPGKLVFGREEIIGMPNISGYTKTPPYLKSFKVLVGDGEVGKFLGERVVSGRANRIEDFFRLLKVEGELEKRIEAHNFKQREGIFEELLRSVALLKSFGEQVRDVEESILRATYSEGRDSYGEWFSKWSNQEQVDKYGKLRDRITEIIEGVKERIRKSQGLDLEKHPSVDGSYLGFPAKVSPTDYLSNVSDAVLPKIEEMLGKIDRYLSGEMKKARRDSR